MPLSISKQTARRYVLGRHGLWPGRRWVGHAGTKQALRQCECVQIDTINAIARNHDLKLWSRVRDYAPEMLDSLLYKERLFFDFGSILMVYPHEEMPYWRSVMRWQRERLAPSVEARRAVVEHVREAIRSRGPLASRDFADRERIPGGFNTIKDSALALYFLWLGGEIVTHSRRGFDRVYDLAENVTPMDPNEQVCSDLEAQNFFARKAMRDLGLATPVEWTRRVRVYLHRTPDGTAKKTLESLAEEGHLVPIAVEGAANPRWMPAEDVPILRVLEAGTIPDGWRPAAETTQEEVNFLAPLDNVIWDRARTLALFDFDYVWEVYKPAHLRRWGYYTLPILWGDRLVARFAPRLNRKMGTLAIEGVWLENDALANDPAFIEALGTGLRRFCRFHQAGAVHLGPMEPLLGSGFARTLER